MNKLWYIQSTEYYSAIKRKELPSHENTWGKIKCILLREKVNLNSLVLYDSTIWPFSVSHSVMSDSLQPHGLQPDRLPCSWDSPGKNTGVGCHSVLQGIFLTQGLNLGLLHCRQMLYHLSHWGNPSDLCDKDKTEHWKDQWFPGVGGGRDE